MYIPWNPRRPRFGLNEFGCGSLIPAATTRMIRVLLIANLKRQTLRSALVNNMLSRWSSPSKYLFRHLLLTVMALMLGSIAAPAIPAGDQPSILPLEQVKAGMKGVAYT